LKEVVVSPVWAGGPPQVTESIRVSLEERLRKAGLNPVRPNIDIPILSIQIAQLGQATMVDVSLAEPVYLVRDSTRQMSYTALAAYVQMYQDARAKGIPVTDADVPDIVDRLKAELTRSEPLPQPVKRSAIVWQRKGVAPHTERPEYTPATIVARYKVELADPNLTPADRAMKERMMNLEVQAAVAKCQAPVTINDVRQAVDHHIEEFIRTWTIANPPPIPH
jgi:hypothetical protein